MYLKPSDKNTLYTRDNQDFLYFTSESLKISYIESQLDTSTNIETFRKYKNYLIDNDITIIIKWETENAMQDLKKNCFIAYDDNEYSIWHVENARLINANIIEYTLIKDVISSSVNLLDTSKELDVTRGHLPQYKQSIFADNYPNYQRKTDPVTNGFEPLELDSNDLGSIDDVGDFFVVYASQSYEWLTTTTPKSKFNEQGLPYIIYIIPKSQVFLSEDAIVVHDTDYNITFEGSEIVLNSDTDTYTVDDHTIGFNSVYPAEWTVGVVNDTTGETRVYTNDELPRSVKLNNKWLYIRKITPTSTTTARINLGVYTPQSKLLSLIGEDPFTIKMKTVKELPIPITPDNIINGTYNLSQTNDDQRADIISIGDYYHVELTYNVPMPNTVVFIDGLAPFNYRTEPLINQYPCKWTRLVTNNDVVDIDFSKIDIDTLNNRQYTVKKRVELQDITGDTIFRVENGDYVDNYQTREELVLEHNERTLNTSEWLKYKTTNYELDKANLRTDKNNQWRQFRAGIGTSVGSVGAGALGGAIAGGGVGAGVGAIGGAVNTGINIASSYYNTKNNIRVAQEKFNNLTDQIKKRPPSMKLTTHKPITTDYLNGTGAKYVTMSLPEEILEELAFYFHKYGTPVQGLKKVSTLLSRRWFNYFETENIRTVLNDIDNYSTIELNIIDTLFSNGIRLWNYGASFKPLEFNRNNYGGYE